MTITLESVETLMVLISAGFLAALIIGVVYDKPFLGKEGRRF